MENLILNHTYLVKMKFGMNNVFSSSKNELFSVTILLITEKAYHIRWNKGLITKTLWKSIYDMHNECNVIEDITNIIGITTTNINTGITKCPICNGEGKIPDSRTTAMYIICPVCHGNKNVL